MSDTISQDEINALFSQAAGTEETTGEETSGKQDVLTANDKDVLGEVGNISMGSAATTLSALLNEKVNITTPSVKERYSLTELLGGEEKYVAVDIKYKAGLDGSFMLIIKESDVQMIANMMMGSPASPIDTQASDMQLSAISEAMNQMVGTSCTSMSQVFNNVVDIDPPEVTRLDLETTKILSGINLDIDDYVVVEFDLAVGDILNSKMVQLLPMDVAKQLINKLTASTQDETPSAQEEPAQVVSEAPKAESASMKPRATVSAPTFTNQSFSNAQEVEFEELIESRVEAAKEQISLIQDVPLEVVVELGRTNKSIKEILEFSPGVVIELNKMAGEPIDILINNKFIAKGEVVVIDENFGIRITEIVDVKKRI